MNTLDVRTWIEIDKKAIANNYKIFRSLLAKKTRLLAVVKSNAYGHDLVPFATELAELGADFLGVDSCVEGVALRKAGIKTPILVLGFVLPAALTEAVDKNISITVSNFQTLTSLHTLRPVHALKKKIKVHLKIDTGMSRQGFFPEEIARVLVVLQKKEMRHVKLEGVYTHFGAAKNPSFPQSVFAQMTHFNMALALIEKAGYKPIRHACATGGIILFPEFHLDMVRVGIGMYGLWPSEETRQVKQQEMKLTPVLSWKGVISEIKKFKKSAKVGYDFTETLHRNTKTAIIPVGYWHGYPRALSSIGNVLIRGKRARVLGRVSMDMMVVDVTDIPGVKILDIATLLGRDGREEVPADELAGLCETSSYEFVTRLNPKIRRVFM
ncbi:alanine racemase [bacterium]|nr:alanine racemase [bacterium]